MTSAAEMPSSAWMPVGMPRPLSSTLTDPSLFNVISTRSQCPASASSIALSETSNTMRSEEHTSELQSLMRISYAVFCMKNKNNVQNLSHKQPRECHESPRNNNTAT